MEKARITDDSRIASRSPASFKSGKHNGVQGVLLDLQRSFRYSFHSCKDDRLGAHPRVPSGSQCKDDRLGAHPRVPSGSQSADAVVACKQLSLGVLPRFWL